MKLPVITLCALMLGVGCDASSDPSPTPTDATPTDATPPDATPADATPTDAALPDAALADAALPDAIPPDATPPEMLPEQAIYDPAGACVALVATLDGERRGLRAVDEAAEGEAGYAFAADATPLRAHPSDLGTYLLYDPDGGYVVAEHGPLLRRTALESDLDRLDDVFISGAEWILERSPTTALRLQLRHRRTDRYLGRDGLVDRVRDAVALTLEPAEGCAVHPEMSLDAAGEVTRTHFDDGELFGFVDAHAHILSSFGYGGGGIFHGAAFHRLGVSHAMGSCEPFHGADGRADFLGATVSGQATLTIEDLVPLLTTGLLPEPSHATDGWPTFSDWPTVDSATHQTMYYRWLERAWMGGLRLVVQHAVSNEALCGIAGDTGFQPIRWSCRDMTNIDRQIDEIGNLERYIDARSGGPGRGWLRVVHSPAEARDVIGAGKLAVVLGIEVPNLFACYVTPGPDDPECDTAYIEAQLDAYRARGVRVLFPTHKSDNAFTPGDGSRGMLEIANFAQTGHWSNFTDDCPDVDTAYDKGPVVFGGFNMPRDAHLAPAPNPPIRFSSSPLTDISPYLAEALAPPLEGDWCQALGLTDKGRTLMAGIMARGMLPELDHLPRRSYIEAFDMLEAADYPALATHRNLYGGRLWDIGGLSALHIGRCAPADRPGALFEGFIDQSAARVAAGLHPSVGFGFDFNGLAGVPRPRFGPEAGCPSEQADPVLYPFTSFAGDVTFTAPAIGERPIDFNTEGMIHVGLIPELIEDARRTGTTDEELEILFRSAEGYVQLWERAEARAAALGGRFIR